MFKVKFNPTTVGILLMIAAMQVVPINDALAKILSQSIPVAMVVCLRTFMQSIFLFVFNLAMTRGKLPERNAMFSRWHILRGFLWWLSTFLFFLTIKDHDIPPALALFFTGPIFVALAAPILLREKFDWRFLLAALIGFAGTLIIVRPSSDEIQLGLLWSLAAGVCYGSYLIATRHAALDKALAAGEIAFGAGFWATVFGLPAALYVWQTIKPEFVILLLIIGIASALGHILIALACQRTSATSLAPYHYTEMFGAIIVSFALFGTLPVAGVWIGIVMIICSGAWALIASHQRPVDAIV